LRTKPQSYKPYSLATWNIRTLLDTDSSERPPRRTALVASELNRYNIDIAALSETRLQDEGSLTEVGEGYTFFWKGISLLSTASMAVALPFAHLY